MHCKAIARANRCLAVAILVYDNRHATRWLILRYDNGHVAGCTIGAVPLLHCSASWHVSIRLSPLGVMPSARQNVLHGKLKDWPNSKNASNERKIDKKDVHAGPEVQVQHLDSTLN